MHEKIVFYSFTLLLVIAGCWGIWLIAYTTASSDQQLSQPPATTPEPDDSGALVPPVEPYQGVVTDTPKHALSNIQMMIINAQYEAAANSINTHYSELSSDDLAELKSSFLGQLNILIRAEDYSQAQLLLKQASAALDDLRIWKSLASVSIRLGDSPGALTAQLKSANLETNPQDLEDTLLAIVTTASQIRALYERDDDQVSIQNLYQRLNAAHPGYPRFELELAQSYIRLDSPELAIPILEQLQYDPRLGRIAEQNLAALRAQEKSSEQEPIAAVRDNATQTSDILVPLKRVGNSFLVSTSINGRSLPLLLDTGASITSLSTDLIRRLKLQPTGQSIQLSTANGITRSKLYRAKNVRLGRLSISDLVVAEIDLKRNNGFQGLLGTDLLNRINTNYSYLIDNQQNALIFRRR